MRLDVYVFVIVLGFECIVVSCCKVGVRTSDLMVRQRMWLGKFMLKFTEVGEGKFMECSGNLNLANNGEHFQEVCEQLRRRVGLLFDFGD